MSLASLKSALLVSAILAAATAAPAHADSMGSYATPTAHSYTDSSVVVVRGGVAPRQTMGSYTLTASHSASHFRSGATHAAAPSQIMGTYTPSASRTMADTVLTTAGR